MGRTETVSTQKTTMKNIFLLSIVSLAILQPLAEAIFLGPIAVGVALGAVAVKKGLILGSVLSQRRTSHRSGRIYTRYNRRSHYIQPRTYYQHYTQPRTYYYSSDNHYDNHHDHHYGKRFAAPEPISMEELMSLKREVTDKIMTDDWYMEMVEKDQDDCTKRLICEISSKKENGEVLTEVESEIIGIFGQGRSVDTSKSTAIFDFAAQAGKYWKKGGYGCEFFARCDTPTSDIVAMIENELEDFRQLEESFLNDASKMESAMEEENKEVEKMVNSL